MKRVLMDTNYWISLKQNPQRFKEFYDTVSSDNVRVYISTGNFIDLIKADEQDVMAKILVAISDKVLPPTPEEGDEFYISDYVTDLIPDDEYREYVRRETRHLDSVKTFQQVFRDSTWSATEGYFTEIELMRDLYEEWGADNLKGLAFEEYLEQHGDEYILHDDEVDIVTYVRREIFLHRVSMMDSNEKVDENDVADIVICRQAILSDCDMLLIEAKWANLGLVESVTENIEMDSELEVYKDFDEFHQNLNMG